jgi:hypothetical protein
MPPQREVGNLCSPLLLAGKSAIFWYQLERLPFLIMTPLASCSGWNSAGPVHPLGSHHVHKLAKLHARAIVDGRGMEKAQLRSLKPLVNAEG